MDFSCGDVIHQVFFFGTLFWAVIVVLLRWLKWKHWFHFLFLVSDSSFYLPRIMSQEPEGHLSSLLFQYIHTQREFYKIREKIWKSNFLCEVALLYYAILCCVVVSIMTIPYSKEIWCFQNICLTVLFKYNLTWLI